MSAYAHLVASVYSNVYADAHNTCECIHALRKNSYALVHARLCNGAEASLLWKLLRTYLESCASIVQAAVCRPPSCRLDEISHAAWLCSLKKSVQIHASSWCGRHCGVAQVSLDHPRWCRPHLICLWVALEARPRGSLHQKSKNSSVTIFFTGFFSTTL